jgi:hypothetical protein
MKDTRCGSLCLDLYEPHKCFAPLHRARKRSWGLNFTALWEGIQMLGKLVGSAFQPSPPFLARCPHDDERIVVRGCKLILRANQKGFPDQSSTAVASTLRLPARLVDPSEGSTKTHL